MASPLKAEQVADTLSQRDRAILDAFSAGTTRKQLAEQYNLTLTRICQICKSPAAVAYLTAQGGIHKALINARVSGEILSRTEWGGMKMTDLIAIWKASMPQEVNLNVSDTRKDAEAIAAEIGKADDPAVVAQIERDLLISQEAR